ncbi:MAG: hypothetical protein RDU25_03450 [Patescibacteria group bacterium]|nr:hypothetical protein [Patescibacteria group bacterium]
MDGQKSTSRYILTALAIILVITAFILVALNALDINTPLPNPLAGGKSAEDAYREGFLKAREKYAAICPMIGLDSDIISGKVTSVAGDSVVIEQTTFGTDETIDGVSDLRTIKNTATTKVVKIVPKDQAKFHEELSAFKPTAEGNTIPPSPTSLQAASFSDIKVGDTIRITSDKNLRLEAEITAVEIDITPAE